MQLVSARSRSRSNHNKYFEDLLYYEQRKLQNLEEINQEMAAGLTHRPKINANTYKLVNRREFKRTNSEQAINSLLSKVEAPSFKPQINKKSQMMQRT